MHCDAGWSSNSERLGATMTAYDEAITTASAPLWPRALSLCSSMKSVFRLTPKEVT